MANQRTTLTDYNRNNSNFNQSRVNNVLPEHFQDQYPVLVELVDKYYDWMSEWQDSAGRMPVSELQEIAYLKDRETMPERFFEYMFNEAINGLGADFFNLPRLALKYIPGLYQAKGTVISSEGFFRYLYNIDPDLIYPKNQMFIVGESEIGVDSLRYIQDSYFYQIYSILVKSSIPAAVWREVYTQYVHPSGFALFAEVLFETLVTNVKLNDTMPLAIPDVDATTQILVDTASITITAPMELMTGVDSDLNLRFLVDKTFNLYDSDTGTTIGDLDSSYSEYASLSQALNADAWTFDDSSDIHHFSNTVNTLDRNDFEYYSSYGPDTV